jgi:hypothetical protein
MTTLLAAISCHTLNLLVDAGPVALLLAVLPLVLLVIGAIMAEPDGPPIRWTRLVLQPAGASGSPAARQGSTASAGRRRHGWGQPRDRCTGWAAAGDRPLRVPAETGLTATPSHLCPRPPGHTRTQDGSSDDDDIADACQPTTPPPPSLEGRGPAGNRCSAWWADCDEDGP